MQEWGAHTENFNYIEHACWWNVKGIGTCGLPAHKARLTGVLADTTMWLCQKHRKTLEDRKGWQVTTVTEHDPTKYQGPPIIKT